MQRQEALGRGVGCLLDPSPFLGTDGAASGHSTLPWHNSVQAQEGSELPTSQIHRARVHNNQEHHPPPSSPRPPSNLTGQAGRFLDPR